MARKAPTGGYTYQKNSGPEGGGGSGGIKLEKQMPQFGLEKSTPGGTPKGLPSQDSKKGGD